MQGGGLQGHPAEGTECAKCGEKADKKRVWVTEGMQVGSSYWKVLVLRGLGSWDESEAGGVNNRLQH